MKYTIKGKEIEGMKSIEELNETLTAYWNTTCVKINELLEALDEKKEEPKPIKTYNMKDGRNVTCSHGKRMFVEDKCMLCMPMNKIKYEEEPKSTLREEAKEIILMDKTYPTASERANKILSLFKDTLLKEIETEIFVFGGCSSCDKCECQMKYKDAIKNTIIDITNLIKNI